MNLPIVVLLPDLEATRQLAMRIAKALESCIGRLPVTIALTGTLGSGKTQWIRYLCEVLGVPSEAVTSPTYVLLQRYPGRTAVIYHIDFYRLEHESQVWDLGIDELQEQPVLILVEWADKFPQTLPAGCIEIKLEHTVGDQRTATLNATGQQFVELLNWLSTDASL